MTGVPTDGCAARGYRIFVTAPRLAKAGQQALADAGCHVTYLQSAEDPAEVEELMATHAFDAVISRTVRLSAKAIDSCPSLKVICKHGVGVTNIDVTAATDHGIPVFTTPGTNTVSVAELTIGLMFAAARKIAFFDAELRAGRWTRTGDGRQLHGRTLGLVGFGQIGRQVAAVATALGMPVRVFDPALSASASPSASGRNQPVPAGVIVVSSLLELCASSDVLSLHCPVNAHTRGMIDAAAIAAMPDGAIVINTARGELIDESALVAALDSGKLAAAALDTYAIEPLDASHPLTLRPNVVLTPHVGGSTPDALDAVSTSAVATCLRFLDGQLSDADAASCVNPAVLHSESTSDNQVIA